MNTNTRSLYKIWRFDGGRSLTRNLTEEQVEHYKKQNPKWRFRKIQASSQPNPWSSSPEAWGKICSELAHNRSKLRDKSIPAISYDDILDLHLALEKGV